MKPTMPGKAPSVPQERRPPPEARQGKPCVICESCRREGEPTGIYTREGLKRHRFAVHGEVGP